jgi:hypothetical protein
MSLRRKIFYGFTLAVVAVLLILPATGWLARLQLLPFTLPGASPLISPGDENAQKRYRKHAADVVAEAAATSTSSSPTASAPVPRVIVRWKHYVGKKISTKRFPRNPVVIAAILKTMTQEVVKVQRPKRTCFLPRTAQGKAYCEGQAE